MYQFPKKPILIAITATGVAAAVIISAVVYHRNTREESEALNAVEKEKRQEWVILLHGIFRSPRSMNRIQKALEKEGYRVINFGYPSTKEPIERISLLLDKEIMNLPKTRGKLHFVTHSLGAIVVRYYLAHNKVRRAGRIVMIAPPNRGSTLATFLKKWQPYKWVFGKAGQEVTGSPDSLPSLLPAPGMEFGVIAGGTGKKRGINPLIPGDNDGTVRVEETRLREMKDFILIRGQHSTLLLQPAVIANVVAFLKTGRFLHQP